MRDSAPSHTIRVLLFTAGLASSGTFMVCAARTQLDEAPLLAAVHTGHLIVAADTVCLGYYLPIYRIAYYHIHYMLCWRIMYCSE